jgi:hypothetical protein
MQSAKLFFGAYLEANASIIGSGAHPASYPMGTRVSIPGGKPAGREDDHSPPSSTEVKNAWSYTSTTPIQLQGVVLS